MKRFFRNPLKLFVILFVTVVFTAVAYAQPNEEQKEVSLGLPQQIGNFYAFALGIGGLIALGVLVFGGILYTTSAGNASRQDDAKQWITGAFVGLIILFGSFFILNTINPELTKLTDLKLLANKAAGGLAGNQGAPTETGVVIVDGQACPVLSGYSYSNDFYDPRPTTGTHGGIDILASRGTPLVAIEDGVIGEPNAEQGKNWQALGGWRLWLDGKSGNRYYYAHTDDPSIIPLPGTRIKAGDQVAVVGNSGGAERTAPGSNNAGPTHVHFEIWQGGNERVNPFDTLQKLCVPGSTPSTESPALAQVLNKPQYSSFGIAFQEIGGQGTSINSSKQLQSASLYKLFVAKYLYEQREKGRISLDTTVDLNRVDLNYAKREDQRDGTPYPWGTRTKIPIKECLPQMISASENACGAVLKALARDLAGGESQINTQIGGNTTLYPQRTTAEDVANLLLQIAQGKLINQAVSAEFEGLLQNQIHQNKIPEGVPSGAQVGNKTGEIWPDEGLGYTNSHDAAIIRYNGKTYILVVLTSYNPADERTNQTIRQLTDDLFSALK